MPKKDLHLLRAPDDWYQKVLDYHNYCFSVNGQVYDESEVKNVSPLPMRVQVQMRPQIFGPEIPVIH